MAHDPDARAEYLDRACAGDDSLRREVESLIASHEKDGSFIDNPAYQAAAQSLTRETLTKGRVIGHYEILAVLGKGGMGEVYLAQDRKLDRKVALKILPGDVAADQNRMQRFVREAKSAAALNHPNIAHDP